MDQQDQDLRETPPQGDPRPQEEPINEMTMEEALAQFEGEAERPTRDPAPATEPPAQESAPRRGQTPRTGQPSSGAGERDVRHGHSREPGGRRGNRETSADEGGGRERARTARPTAKVEVLANTSFEETRVAILEDGRLVELLWERRNAQSIVGNIYKGVVENVLPGISSAFINIGFEKNAYLYISDVLGDTRQPIDHILKRGQQVMIQVAKEAIGTKGMKVSMDVTLPGRYLVLSPFQKDVGISKQIMDAAERARLTAIIERIARELLEGKGLVVRTEAEGATEAQLVREAKYLLRAWEAIQRRYESGPPSCPLHKDLDLTMQVARDVVTEETYVYLLDNKEEYHDVLDFVGKISPELKDRIRLYDGKTPIFSAFNIESEIEKLRQTKVSLPSGGTIVIQEAESLCAIDVNTGRFTGSKSQEETVTMTNIEAAQEIAHQLRLRNIGGIVVIDFIDMRRASNRNRVMEALAEAVQRDRAKIRILPITRLGLIEMTRERKRESTVSLMTDECPECRGAGRVLSAESLRIRIQREIHGLTHGRPGGQIRLQLHPQLAEAFKEKQGVIERNVHRAIKIHGDSMLSWEDYRIILE
ncbi:MAG: Rne/Rng family ribonuclease [Elusimicrobia bacterium]|nr:Rne/Rng family ribonuclease [Elusimicrobiota bacterium]